MAEWSCDFICLAAKRFVMFMIRANIRRDRGMMADGKNRRCYNNCDEADGVNFTICNFISKNGHPSYKIINI